MFWHLKMNRIFIFLPVLLGLGLPSAYSQVITPVDARESMLDGMQATLTNIDLSPGEYSAVQSPFVVREKEEVDLLQPEDFLNLPDNVVSGEPLPDDVALGVIGQQFKPFGSLVMGNRGILQLANGRTIAAGESFEAQIKGVTYEVTISKVNSDGYQLSLGTATIEKTFLTTTGTTH